MVDFDPFLYYMGVSKYRGTPKSSILIGFSIINHPFWGTPIFGNIHIPTLASCRRASNAAQSCQKMSWDLNVWNQSGMLKHLSGIYTPKSIVQRWFEKHLIFQIYALFCLQHNSDGRFPTSFQVSKPDQRLNSAERYTATVVMRSFKLHFPWWSLVRGNIRKHQFWGTKLQRKNYHMSYGRNYLFGENAIKVHPATSVQLFIQ